MLPFFDLHLVCMFKTFYDNNIISGASKAKFLIILYHYRCEIPQLINCPSHRYYPKYTLTTLKQYLVDKYSIVSYFAKLIMYSICVNATSAISGKALPRLLQMLKEFGFMVIHGFKFQICNKISHIDNIFVYNRRP